MTFSGVDLTVEYGFVVKRGDLRRLRSLSTT